MRFVPLTKDMSVEELISYRGKDGTTNPGLLTQRVALVVDRDLLHKDYQYSRLVREVSNIMQEGEVEVVYSFSNGSEVGRITMPILAVLKFENIVHREEGALMC